MHVESAKYPMRPMYEGRQKNTMLQALLFRHVCLLVFILGIFSTKHLLFAISCLALILIVDSRTWRIAPCLLLILCFGTGYLFYTLRHEPINSVLPTWASLHPDERAPIVPLEAQISNVESLPDRRLRITLDDVRLQGNLSASPLPAKLIWTWDKASTRPLIGQHVALSLPLRPIGGFANEGSFDSKAYWHNKGVVLRAWSRGKHLSITHDTPRADTVWREYLRAKVAQSLGLPKAYQTPEKATSQKDFAQNISVQKDSTQKDSIQRANHATQSTAIIMALLFGDKYYLNNETVELFRASGLAHSLALSGQHLSVAALMALALVLLYGIANPHIFERLPRGKLILLLSLPFALFYLWLGSAPPSLVRATCMLGIGVVLLMQNKHRQLLDSLCLTLVIMVVISPASLFDLSLQLSFLALAGIALVLPINYALWQRMGQYEERQKPALQRFVRKCFWGLGILACTSLAAQAGTLPLSLSTFGTQSPYSFLNLLWLPVLSFWVLPSAFAGLFCTMIGLDSLGQFFLLAAAWPCEGALAMLHFGKSLGMEAQYFMRPSWSMGLGYAAIVVALALRVNRTHFPESAKRCLVAGCVLLCVTPFSNSYANYTAYRDKAVRLRMLDVGQGQAVLLEWASKPFATGLHRLLIDGGGFNSPRFNSGSGILSPVLTQGRFPHIDSIVLTHPDTDHMEGLIFLANTFRIRDAYIPVSAHPGLAKITKALVINKIPTKYIQKATSIRLSSYLRLELLPAKIMQGNDGLAVRLVYEDYEDDTRKDDMGLALVFGDMEVKGQQYLLDTYGASLKSHTIIVPHHGSARNILLPLYDQLAPNMALASCGFGNWYRFPSKSLRHALATRKIPFLTTAAHGEVSVTWHEGKLEKMQTFK